MSQPDLYALLGVSRDADAEAIKKAYRRQARQLHRTSTPTRRRSRGSRRSGAPTRSCRTRRSARRTTAEATRSADGRRLRPGRRLLVHRHHGRVLRRPAGGQARGPRPRTRRGQDALIRLEVELAEAAFGVTRELKVDTAVVCSTCHGEGAAPGTHPQTCETCRGAGEVAQVQRSFLGEIRTLRPCAACRGFGSIIPDRPRVLRRRAGPVAPDADDQDPGRRRHRHPGAARRRG